MLWAQSTTKDYIRAEHKLHSISKLFISQVVIPQVRCFFESIYIPRARNTGTFTQQRNLSYSAGLHRNRCYPRPTQEKIGRCLEKNAGEWTGRVQISKEEITGSKRSSENLLRFCSFFFFLFLPIDRVRETSSLRISFNT